VSGAIVVCGLVLTALQDRRSALAQTVVTDSDLERASAGRTIRIGPAGVGQPVSLPLEVYVARVIAGEGEPGAPDATQEALAIAIRTFAMANQGRHAGEGFDLCDSTHCQVPRVATAATRRATRATAGRVLTYNGATAEVFYSASCGGHSESADQVWPGVDLPYLKSRVDDVHADDVPWTLERSLTEIQRALAAAGFSGARLTDVVVQTRNDSGRAARVAVPGLRPESVAGDTFRKALGAATLRSTAFTIARRGDTITFTGRGYGHGVGMCVIGAGRRARRGETVEQILAAYYPGAALRDLSEVGANRIVKPGATTTPAALASGTIPALGVVPPAAVPPPAPPPIVEGTTVSPRRVAGDAAPSVPTVVRDLEERVRRAHTAVAAALGLTSAPVAVEVYDTIDAFRRVTGRPWWVAFDQRPMAIAIGPTALADVETLDAALRASMADRLMAPALAGRPAWTRVGGARYVARVVGVGPVSAVPQRLAVPAALPAPPGKGPACPADAELTLAVSAAAQREAEARAEACFVRAFQASRDWRSVR
jgi:stage II sporulation protein D